MLSTGYNPWQWLQSRFGAIAPTALEDGVLSETDGDADDHGLSRPSSPLAAINTGGGATDINTSDGATDGSTSPLSDTTVVPSIQPSASGSDLRSQSPTHFDDGLPMDPYADA